MGRLTEEWAEDKADYKGPCVYTASGKEKPPGATILKDHKGRPKTLQQINAHCEKIAGLRLTAHPDGKLMFESLAIIRQLQADIVSPKCGSCGEPMSSDCPTCKRLWES